MVAYIQSPKKREEQVDHTTATGSRAIQASGVDLTSATSVSRSYLTGVLETWLAADGSVVTTHKGESTEYY